ncbi:hypothetical protein FB451DRAFT_1244576 [Mycena latifolia]|nr:hypothetical protein FB451DRAFT_1244576 [Mycena latifolia]
MLSKRSRQRLRKKKALAGDRTNGIAALLPHEVHKRVIEQFVGNSQELCRLSQVSRAWAAVAQPLLFDQADIKLGLSPESLADFSSLLKCKPHLARSVRRLSVFMGIQHFWNDHMDFFSSLDEWLPNLHQLGIIRNDFTHRNPFDTLPASAWRRITDLQLLSCVFASQNALYSLLFLMPCLKRLSISYEYIRHRDTEPFRAPPNVPRLVLEYLSLGEDLILGLTTWIAMHGDDPIIDTLAVECRREFEPLNTLFRNVGAGISNLKLWVPVDAAPAVSLAPCTALRRLELPLSERTSLTAPSPGSMHSCLRLLQNISCPTVQQITLAIDLQWIPGEEPLEYWEQDAEQTWEQHTTEAWEKITTVLLGPRFPNLRTVRFNLQGRPVQGSGQANIDYLHRRSAALGRWVNVEFEPTFDEDGQIARAIAEVRDRWRAEREENTRRGNVRWWMSPPTAGCWWTLPAAAVLCVSAAIIAWVNAKSNASV